MKRYSNPKIPPPNMKQREKEKSNTLLVIVLELGDKRPPDVHAEHRSEGN
jgi:hypothetical protein